jgi:hypothetical protein
MKSMKLGLRIAGTIFGIVAVIHLSRILSGAAVLIEGWSLPIWVNFMGFIGSGFLCIWLWLLSKNS